MSVCDHLSQVGISSLSVYTDGSLRSLGTVGCRAGAAVFFEDINLGLDIRVSDLMLFTLAKMQTIALALECVPLFGSVCLFSDSQFVLDACKLELALVCPNFHNQYWVECQHIVNIICNKNLSVSWHKIKGYSGILENEYADSFAGDVSISNWFFLSYLSEHFLMADGSIISGNSKHFEIGSGLKFLSHGLVSEIDWHHSLLVWHPDLHMATGYTSKASANILPVMRLLSLCTLLVLLLEMMSSWFMLNIRHIWRRMA
ncbi:hypothetical protein G9A89_005589 [Geosiphon pyriformis]|nr:hypothetical protein G9A89_005589 [Geosiphon pyriformis]